MSATSKIAIVSYTAEPYLSIAQCLHENLSEKLRPDLVLLNSGTMASAYLTPIAHNLDRYAVVILHVQMDLWGPDSTRAMDHFLSFVQKLHCKIVFLIDKIPFETFNIYDHVWRTALAGRHMPGRIKRAVQEYGDSRRVHKIWAAIAHLARENRAVLIAGNQLKLNFWQRVAGIKEDARAGFLQVLNHVQRDEARDPPKISALRAQYGLGAQDIVLAVIGDVTGHSGLKTVLRAMAYLPPSYKLLICGAMKLPPASNISHTDVYIDVFNCYLEDIKKESSSDGMPANKWLPLAQIFKNIKRGNESITARELDLAKLLKIGERSDDLHQLLDEIWLALPEVASHQRVRFIKPESLQHTANMAAAANACVFADTEVGAVADPYLALASEVQDNLFVSYNQQHSEFMKLQPGRAILFDIGNDLELAQKLRRLESGIGLASPTSSASAPSLAEVCQQVLERMLTR